MPKKSSTPPSLSYENNHSNISWKVEWLCDHYLKQRGHGHIQVHGSAHYLGEGWKGSSLSTIVWNKNGLHVKKNNRKNLFTPN